MPIVLLLSFLIGIYFLYKFVTGYGLTWSGSWKEDTSLFSIFFGGFRGGHLLPRKKGNLIARIKLLLATIATLTFALIGALLFFVSK